MKQEDRLIHSVVLMYTYDYSPTGVRYVKIIETSITKKPILNSYRTVTLFHLRSYDILKYIKMQVNIGIGTHISVFNYVHK